MKKFICLFLALCVILPCALFIGCKDSDNGLTKTEYVEAIDSVTTNYNAYVAQSTVAKVKPFVVFEESDYINIDHDEYSKQILKSTLALILFMKNILITDGYELSNNLDDCVASFKYYNFDIRFRLSYDSETGTIHIPILAEYSENTQDGPLPMINYFVFEINYDFITQTLNQFTAKILFAPKANQTASDIEYYRYKDNSVCMLNPSSPKQLQFAEEHFASLAEFMSTPKESKIEDYSEQYNNAMEVSQAG